MSSIGVWSRSTEIFCESFCELTRLISMTKVYVLNQETHDGDNLYGIFSTYEQAEIGLKELEKHPYYRPEIQEWTLDKLKDFC